MSRRSLLAPATLVTALIAALAAPMASAQEKVLNIYSARHYQTDEALYSNFTKTTGIKLNRIDGRRTSWSSASATRVPPARRTS